MEKLQMIEVTAEDIGTPGEWTGPNGQRGRGSRCMMDRTLDRLFGYQAFDTLIHFAVGRGKYNDKVIKFPQDVSEKIAAWDTKQKVKPFVFTAKIEKG